MGRWRGCGAAAGTTLPLCRIPRGIACPAPSHAAPSAQVTSPSSRDTDPYADDDADPEWRSWRQSLRMLLHSPAPQQQEQGVAMAQSEVQLLKRKMDRLRHLEESAAVDRDAEEVLRGRAPPDRGAADPGKREEGGDRDVPVPNGHDLALQPFFQRPVTARCPVPTTASRRPPIQAQPWPAPLTHHRLCRCGCCTR